MSHSVLLSLGSNLGDRLDHLKKAVNSLKKISTNLIVSSVYETEPVGNVPQNNFYNIAVRLNTDLSVNRLFELCQSIESELNRKKVIRWGPRTLDIDIIDYNHMTMKSNKLTIPHPEFHKRNFVLVPLAEIVPDYEINSLTIKTCLKQSHDKSSVMKLMPF